MSSVSRDSVGGCWDWGMAVAGDSMAMVCWFYCGDEGLSSRTVDVSAVEVMLQGTGSDEILRRVSSPRKTCCERFLVSTEGTY